MRIRIEEKRALAVTLVEANRTITFVPSSRPLHWIRVEEQRGTMDTKVDVVSGDQRAAELERLQETENS